LRPLDGRLAGGGADGGSDEGGREEFEEFCPKHASNAARRDRSWPCSARSACTAAHSSRMTACASAKLSGKTGSVSIRQSLRPGVALVNSRRAHALTHRQGA